MWLSIVIIISVNGCSDDSTNCPCGESYETCEDIEKSYKGYLQRNAECISAQDCHLLEGKCTMGLGNSYEAVSEGTQAILDDYGEMWTDLACANQADGGVCNSEEVPNVDCIQKVCKIVEK